MDTEEPAAPPPPRAPPGVDLPPRSIPAPPAPEAQPRVLKATLLAYRLYDIAAEIDLRHVEQLLKGETARVRLVREHARYLELPNPPVSLALGPRELPLRGGPTAIELTARLYDHGALAFVAALRVPSGLAFEPLIQLADEIDDCPALDDLCRKAAQSVSERLRPALQNPRLWESEESYTVTFVEQLEGDPSADALLERCDLPRLLLGEPPTTPLSEQQRGEVLRGLHRYTERDLALIDWNSAFVYEPSGSRDIPDLLEIANAQLLEMRYYDDLLDRELASIYSEVNQPRRPWHSIFSGRYGKLRRRTLALLLELGEFTERVENSLKIIGDFYLAQVYETAVRQLRVPDWQHSVYRKQGLLNGVYSLLKSEVDTDRLLWLEITVVLLILGELLMALHVV